MHSTVSQESSRTIESEFVLPQPPRPRATLVFGAEHTPHALLQRAAAGLPVTGRRLQVLLECQEMFFAEMRATLGEARAALDAGARQRSSERLATLAEILDWCEASQRDLLSETRHAAMGEQVIDLQLLCDDVVHELRGSKPGIEVHVHGGSSHAVFGDVMLVGEVVRRGIDAVAARIGGEGHVTVTILDEAAGPSLWIRASGEPRRTMDAVALERFRDAAADAGVAILPDATGPNSAGLILRLPGRIGAAS
jgi:hypothetical protein